MTDPDETPSATSPPREITVAVTPDLRAFRQFAEHMQRQQTALARAFQGFGRQIQKAATHVHAATARAAYGDAYGRHRRRCRACNPAGNPQPLKVNGADYARRRKNRRRRG